MTPDTTNTLRSSVRSTMVVCAVVVFCAVSALADPPNLQTPAPVIYLADNLDEADQLGWCIDTLGRGFSYNLHAHSCKPRGGDVQFGLEPATGLIRSVAFPEYCMEYQSDQVPMFGLLTCAPTKPGQVFVFDATQGALSPGDDSLDCVTVGGQSRAAGPFMSRDLLLALCVDTDPKYRTWVVKHD